MDWLAIATWVGVGASIGGVATLPFLYAAAARAERLRMRVRLLESARPAATRDHSPWGDVIQLHPESRHSHGSGVIR